MATSPQWRPRLVATDLDGTVVRSDGRVGQRTRRALAAVEDAGVPLVLVTGRPPRWMHPVVEETGHRGVAVCANGAVVYDLHFDQVLAAHTIDAEVAAEVVRLLRDEVPGVHFAAERTGVGTDPFVKEVGYEVRWPQPFLHEAEISEVVGTPMVKLLARVPDMDSDLLLEAGEATLGDLVTLTHSSSGGLLEMSARGVSKASGLRHLADGFSVASEDVVAFGDMPNDLPMLAWAGWSVAVSNAHVSVRDAADEVTLSNDEDGVARVLERYFGV